MKILPLSIEGAFEVRLDRLGDRRGYFGRVYCEDTFAAHRLNTRWVQANISYTQAKGTVRGLHFQRPPAAEVKMVRAIRGRAHDVLVDLRAGSSTFGQCCTVDLDADAKNAVYIPTGCAHGFQTLCDDVELHYSHSHVYAPEYEGGVHPQDTALRHQWPLPVVQLSDRDQALPLLADCEPIQ
ncbi:dTDP-4-dehydrorhamnose 3,5-epimerase family protein [Gymnodinialimonas hymeniacidonis]|uniref:dTDP-4-dehydrorhamnose 3,5-epimerase family protein n=1 Tax=Gymnodinialimonas hymeniacidonis TaxID=3126508 RepID=UPI0034C693C6